MCGRFVRESTIPEILKAFDMAEGTCELKPSYNIAPGQDIAVIINGGKTRLIACRWGFIPPWAKEASSGYKMINARAETAAEKPSFRGAFRKQRAVIVADGFYEWRKEKKGKTPFYIHLKSKRPFGFAGLYNVWTSPEGEKIPTCTILTTDANELLRPIHDRMPVILPKEGHTRWLDPAVHDASALAALLKPHSAAQMVAYPVSPRVNVPKNDSPENIRPVA
jgi:putative SOS response-associated peptidase YedK